MKIIVGVDGSEPSLQALRWAAHEARRRKALIRVVACYSVPAYGGMDGAIYPSSVDVEMLKAESAAVVSQAIGIVGAIDPTLVVDGVTSMSSPVVGIAELAIAGDEIVVGATGHSGALDGLIGSVTTGVTHRAHVPVVVVPSRAPTASDDAMRSIVVGVDGSPGSLLALEWAYDEARATGAELNVVHAWICPYSISETSVREVRKPIEFAAVRELQSSLDSLGTRLTDGAVIVHSTLSEKSPAEALLQEAEGADLLVVGSRGRGGLRSLLLGSVSRTVLHHAVGPVAVIRSTGGNDLEDQSQAHHLMSSK